MQWSKAKSILLLLMLCANIYLGLNILFQLRERDEQAAQAVSGALSIIEERGVILDGGLLEDMASTKAGYVYTRDTEAERRAAELLLGECGSESPGGGIYIYSSDRGVLTFRSGGYIELEWLDDENQPDLDAFLLSGGRPGFETGESGGGRYLLINGVPVAGAEIKSDGEGRYSGSWVFGSLSLTENGALSAPSMILALGRAYESGGGEVTSLDGSYLLTTMQNGDIRLTPVWRAVCRGRTAYISAVSGEEIAR